jgi:hypothetical protein
MIDVMPYSNCLDQSKETEQAKIHLIATSFKQNDAPLLRIQQT